MLKDITLGQYFPGNTIVHRLDPRTKLVCVLLYFIALFTANGVWSVLLVFSTLMFSVAVSRIKPRALLKGMKPLRMILILTFLLNLFFTQGDTVLLQFWVIRITKEALLQAIFFSLRLVFLVTGTSILTLTTSPVSLSDGLEILLSPLKKIHFPAHELAMMMTIALRFIPTLLEETDKIMKAQTARGADFESGNLLTRAKAMVPLLVPLFVSAFRRAGDLAMAMESRCYHGGEGRTRLRVLKMTRNDLWTFACMLLLLALLILEGQFLAPLLSF